jgi:hypothetical protein
MSTPLFSFSFVHSSQQRTIKVSGGEGVAVAMVVVASGRWWWWSMGGGGRRGQLMVKVVVVVVVVEESAVVGAAAGGTLWLMGGLQPFEEWWMEYKGSVGWF